MSSAERSYGIPLSPGQPNGTKPLTINGIFHRESLHTQSPKEAQRRYREKLKEYQTATPDPSKCTRKLRKLTIAEAIELYIIDRKADVSLGQVKAWRVNARALSGYFRSLRLEQINNAHIRWIRRVP